MLLPAAFHHMGLACADPVAVEAFYTAYFGFQRARVVPVGEREQIVFIRSGSIYLELFKAEPGAESARQSGDGAGPTSGGWRHLAFKVDDVDAKLAEMGSQVRITLGPLSFDTLIQGWRTVWVTDPEGNVIEISQGYTDQ